MKNLKTRNQLNEASENLNISDVSDSSFEFPNNYPDRGIGSKFIPYNDSDEDKADMSLEEKILKMKLNINKVNLTPLQMEVVIEAMKEVTTQRKIGNWTNKVR